MAERNVRVKCKNCGKFIMKADSYRFEYVNKNLEIGVKYYCCEECCNEKEGEKELVNSYYDILNEILEMPVKTNMYFNKMFKEIRENYKPKVIYDFLKCEQLELETVLLKDFKTNNAKIKYFFAVMQDRILKYKNKIESQEKQKMFEKDSESLEIEDEFIPTNENKRKPRRSINDILNGL